MGKPYYVDGLSAAANDYVAKDGDFQPPPRPSEELDLRRWEVPDAVINSLSIEQMRACLAVLNCPERPPVQLKIREAENDTDIHISIATNELELKQATAQVIHGLSDSIATQLGVTVNIENDVPDVPQNRGESVQLELF